MSRTYLAFRYIIDSIVAAILLVLLSPILLIVAILIKRDGGPIFFRQERVGKNANIFRVFKFRSMIVDADDFLNDQGEATRDRITPIGKFIRRTSIDELPQFINILIGDMAMIGPRPILPKMLPFMTTAENDRFAVRPGITGLAQVNGRNNLIWSKRFIMDVEYTNNANVFLDFKIAFKTIWNVFTAKDISEDRNASKVDDITSRKILE